MLEDDLVCSLVYGAIGMAPITALALSILGLVPLHIGGPTLVGSAVATGAGLQVVAPDHGRAVLRGLLAGLVAVLVYDCTRLPFVVIGGWADFIPKIGAWLADDPDTHWSVGYLWRYLGNGAGMGLAFAMIVPFVDHWADRRRLGLCYGVAIWTGLLTTLLVAPDGEAKLFPLTPATLTLSLTGHLVYGSVLGAIHQRWSTSANS